MKTKETNLSNSLIYKETKIVENGNTKIIVTIRLNDECKNGHQDFSITADGYEKRNGHFYESFGGACHGEIKKYFPEYSIFIALHLSTYKGIPIYAVENGFFHIKTEKMEKEKFCEYYRITSDQYDILEKSENVLEFSILLSELKVLEHWKKQADKGIALLEKLTDKTFLIDSKEDGYNKPEENEVMKFNELKKSGYFSDENKKQREKEKIEKEKAKQISDVISYADKEIDKIRKERDVKLYVLKNDLPIDNFIYYSTNKGVFNWKNYDKKITVDEFKKFCDNLNFDALPIGISFQMKDEKIIYKSINQ